MKNENFKKIMWKHYGSKKIKYQKSPKNGEGVLPVAPFLKTR